MTPATATASLEKFRQVYADAVTETQPTETAMEIRELEWHGQRMPLAEAAEAYATICDGYNKFEPYMLARLLEAFPDAGIEVTPAREFSVAVYLHIPTGKEIVAAWVDQNLEADNVGFVTHFTCLQDGEADLVGEALRIWWD